MHFTHLTPKQTLVLHSVLTFIGGGSFIYALPPQWKPVGAAVAMVVFYSMMPPGSTPPAVISEAMPQNTQTIIKAAVASVESVDLPVQLKEEH